jgi:hypothetical protein
MSKRRRAIVGAVGATLVVCGGLLWWAERPKVLVVSTDGRIHLDDGPLGEAVFAADTLTADLRATLAPGRYDVDAPGGRWVLIVPADATVAGTVHVRVDGRGLEDGRRWVTVVADSTRLTFDPPVRVATPGGGAVDLAAVSADGGTAAATVEPLVARSVATWAAGRVWSAPDGAGGGLPISPVREVTVTSGVLSLHEGGQVRWRGADPADTSHLVLGAGSEVRVRDLTVTGAGEIPAGRVSVRLAVGPGSLVRAGGAAVRMDTGDFRAELAVRRTAAEGTRVALAPDTVAALSASRVRVTPPGGGEVTADRLGTTFGAASWEQRPGADPRATVRSRVEFHGVAVPASGPSFPGLRIDALTADVDGGGDAVRLDGVTLRVPKREVLAAIARALPTTFPLPDHPLAENVADLFRDVKVAGLRVEPGQPTLDWAGDRITFSGRPSVHGRLTALGRHDVVTMRMQEGTGPFGIKVKTNWPYHEVSWVPRVDWGFAVPLEMGGHAAVEIVPGPTLADTAVRVQTVCQSVTVGEPTVQGLPEPLRPVAQLAARFRNDIRVDGKALPEHVRRLATREDRVPVFGPTPDPAIAPVLRRITLRAPAIALDGEDVVVTGAVTIRDQ